MAFTRISRAPIAQIHQVESPDFVILFDESVVGPQEVSQGQIVQGASADSTLLVNSRQQQSGFSKRFPGKVFHCPASEIAMSEISRDIPNVPMVGALLQIAKIFPLQEFSSNLKKILSALPEKIIAGNLRAFSRGAAEFFPVQ